MVEAVWNDDAIDFLLISKTILGQFLLHVLNGERDNLKYSPKLKKARKQHNSLYLQHGTL